MAYEMELPGEQEACPEPRPSRRGGGWASLRMGQSGRRSNRLLPPISRQRNRQPDPAEGTIALGAVAQGPSASRQP